MSLAASLWTENEDLARTALEHPFVQGLRDGSLARECFADYILQDAFFLDSFARAYALALAKCPDRAGLRDFSDLLSGVLDELELHASYVARWGIAITGVQPAPATLAYTDFLLATS